MEELPSKIRGESQAGRRQRGEADYHVFRVMTLDELRLMTPEELVEAGMKDRTVYVCVSTIRSKSRKEAIRDQAKTDDSNGVLYGSVAKDDLTEHAPTKKVEWD